MRGAKRVATNDMAHLLQISLGSPSTFPHDGASRAKARRFPAPLHALLGLVLLVIGTWLGVHTLPWFGPWLADSLRSLLGSERVTWLEEAVAHAEDRVQQVTKQGEIRDLSDAVPATSSLAEPAGLIDAVVHRPSDVGPVHAKVKGAGDGVWQAVAVRGTESPVLYRTLLHPDAERTYAELFVFALDLDQAEIHAVAGSVEPKRAEGAPRSKERRPGVVPEQDRVRLFAAFNGGFKAEHGHYGMMSNGVTWLAPKSTSCTFAAKDDGALVIASWAKLKDTSSELGWWRQTPGCMVEDGVMHSALRSPNAKGWGATLEGDTVIRRSAVGLSEDGKVLFVGISNSTTAPALAKGMVHAGAKNVAQLDVNFSYPRFLLYREAQATGSGLLAEGAVKGLLYEDGEYLERASTRDFFYVTLKDSPRAEASR
jgi:hypothetical protein